MKRKDYGAAIFSATLIISFATHIGFVASWLYSRSGEFGSVAMPTQAISVKLEATEIFDVLESAAAKEAASSPAGELAATAVSTEQKDSEEKEERVSTLKPDEALEKKETHVAEEAATEKRQVAEESLEKSPQKQAEREETKHRAEQNAQAEEREKKEKKQMAAVAGGAGTAGSQETEASAGQVSASQGSILNYGASLRAIISAHTPRDVRNRTLKVSFDIAPAGGVTRVDVMKSSGDIMVDSKVVALVRKLSADFPLPPKGAASNQLSYNVEIIFR